MLYSTEGGRMFEEVLAPNKSDVLPFLYGTKDAPPRWAKVVVNQGVAGVLNYSISDYMASLILMGQPQIPY
jgi:hypothetical protein